MYFSLYAVLMKIGVKCEIHSCSIEFAKRLLAHYFDKQELEFLSDSLKARVDAQYYVNRNVPDQQYEEMVKKAPLFLIRCKEITLKLTEQKIKEIRSNLKKIK
jgi:uncharacterized protein (UPF0332 family)